MERPTYGIFQSHMECGGYSIWWDSIREGEDIRHESWLDWETVKEEGENTPEDTVKRMIMEVALLEGSVHKVAYDAEERLAYFHGPFYNDGIIDEEEPTS